MKKIYFRGNNQTLEAICLILNKSINNVEEKQLLSLLTNNYTIMQLDNIQNYILVGPKKYVKSPWNTNTTSIFKNVGLNFVDSCEIYKVYNSTKEKELEIDHMTQDFFTLEDLISEFSNSNDENTRSIYYVNNIQNFNITHSLGFDKDDIEIYKSIFDSLKRKPTNVELFDLAQSNSEHSRHWFFRGKMIIDNYEHFYTLMDKIKNTLVKNSKVKENSLIAFKDNSSAIKGYNVTSLIPNSLDENINIKNTNTEHKCLKLNQYKIKEELCHIMLTAETHNFPTGIAPFPGAATGSGGRIRDNLATGRGGLMGIGLAGYSVGCLNLEPNNYELKLDINVPNTPLNILLKASDGASDYGNKIGEPLTLGFTRTFGGNITDPYTNEINHIEWLKPIMFSAGIGIVKDKDIDKEQPDDGYLVVRVGGPTYRIGVGGGAASSRCQDNKNKNIDTNAVQRGDPEMENKLHRFIRCCIECNENPILSIHDQGAGGMGNVTKEIVSPKGGLINISAVKLGDETLNPLEIWTAESQEQCTFLTKSKYVDLIKYIASREKVNLEFVGIVTNDSKIRVYDKNNNKIPLLVDLPLEEVLESVPSKYYIFDSLENLKKQEYFTHDDDLFKNNVDSLLCMLNVGSKRFLTNKVDRSVSGLVAQQQCIGPFQTPISNYTIQAHSYFNNTGTVSAIGEQPLKGLLSIENMVKLTISELLTNIMWAYIDGGLKSIKCSGNWMWSIKKDSEKWKITKAVDILCENLLSLGVSIDGGKDSLSMQVNSDNKTVICPGTLVLTGYAPINNINCKITPELKVSGNLLYLIKLDNQFRLGGSNYSYIKGKFGQGYCPEVDIHKLGNLFKCIQKFIKKDIIYSGHDISDGGLITTLAEMTISSLFGIDIKINNENNPNNFFFAEDVGVVIEVSSQYVSYIENKLDKYFLHYTLLGKVISDKQMSINYNNKEIYHNSNNNIREIWEKTSFELEKKQTDIECVELEMDVLSKGLYCEYYLTGRVWDKMDKLSSSNYPLLKADKLVNNDILFKKELTVGIVREEGSNGDREMATCFALAGFKTIDLPMTDLLKNPSILDLCVGLAFVGGFSYSDVLGAGWGWASAFLKDEKLMTHFNEFINRPNTFTLGVCNGCQLMSYLNLIPECKFTQNKSKRFDSRMSFVKIQKSNSIMLKMLENCSLGVWIAHGEGRCITSENVKNHNICMNYIDNNNKVTDSYPFNPNGSLNGITAICSDNGRHLAMMPHPERSFIDWQLPWYPFKNSPLKNEKLTPWILMFTQAYDWVTSIRI